MRQIFVVNAYQVVTSEAHPEGAFSTVTGYPKTYDSRDYEATQTNPDGSPDTALIIAQAEYADRVKQNTLAKNRAMWTVTLESADGRMIMHKTYGAFPDMTPRPEPEEEATE